MRKFIQQLNELVKFMKIALLLSLILLVFSLFQNAFYIGREDLDAYVSSSFLFFLGWMSFLGGAFVPFVIWLANPLYFIAIFLTIKGNKMALFIAALPVVLATVFMFLPSILTSESGSSSQITGKGLGFYCWFAAFIVLLVGVIVEKKQKLNT